MKTTKILIVTICVLLLSVALVGAQTGTIQGKVTDSNGDPMPGANVQVVGSTFGSATGDDGAYTITNVPTGSYTLTASFIGYFESKTSVQIVSGDAVTIDFTLEESALPGETLVVSASRRIEKLTDAPASISVVTAKELKRSAGFTYSEGLMKAKGVDVYRTGIDGVGINARGFMTAYSYRMQLMADGRNSMLPGAGLAAGNMLPIARDDIERLEIILGPSSALYGPNAHNGLVNVISKHPRDSEGTTMTVGGGTRSQLIGRFRHAQVVGDKFAFKVNGEFLRADDFVKNDTAAVNAATNAVVFEDPNTNIKNLRLDASAYLSLTGNTEAVATAGYSNTRSVGTTNLGRNQLDGWIYQYYQLRVNHPNFFVQGYLTTNEAGDTYPLDGAASLQAATGVSRKEAIDVVKFVDDSKRYNLEAQGNYDWQGFHFVGGVSYENNKPVSKGTYLTDTTGHKIDLSQTGFYSQLERDLGESFKVVLAGRFDTHSSYDSQFSPRAALVYKLRGKGAFRFTFNKAFQAPAILQQELFFPILEVAPGVMLIGRGNGRGLTLANGTKIKPLEVEENTTFEVGYKGLITDKLYFDVSGYQSKYKNFISPLTVVGDLASGNTVVAQGDGAITAPEMTMTYLNYGEVKMIGFDVGLNYQVSKNIAFWFNYSHIDPEDIKKNSANDLDGDGTVSDSEAEALSFNTSENKFNVGLALSNLLTRGTYLSVSMRHVDAFDFISGRHRATKAGEGTVAAGRTPQYKDHGQLGGFETVDVTFSYAMKNGVTLNISATNILDTKMREMVGSPTIGRLIMGELKYNFNLMAR